MVIKKSSRIFRYLSWLDKVYESKLTESKSLCPLFWKTIIMTLFLPIFLPFIGLINLAKIVIDKYISKMVVPNYIKLGLEMILFCILVAICCFIACGLLWLTITDPLGMSIILGGLFLIISGVWGIMYLLIFYLPEKAETTIIKSKDTSVKDFVIEGISSIKNRVCPLIVFEEDLGVKFYPTKNYLENVTLANKNGAVTWMTMLGNNKRKTDKQLLEDGEENT